MNIDKKIFKDIIGKEADFSNRKDLMTMVSIHYLLSRNDICDSGRVFDFDLTSEGLAGKEWINSIKSKELVADIADKEYSSDAQLIIESLKNATSKTVKECAFFNSAGARTIVIAMGSLACVKDCLVSESATEEEIKKTFETHAMYLKDLYNVANKALNRMDREKERLLKEKELTK